MTGHAPSRSCSPQSPRRLVLLGSTGSIGTQTLEALARLGQASPRVVALAAGGGRLELLARQALAWDVPVLAITGGGEELAEHLDAPLITGTTTVRERQRLYDAFRAEEVSTLVVSKVANFSIDLPGASVAVQVSGSFGSRQEEAQRLGRIVRPKRGGRQAHFYTVVTRDTIDQEFAAHRQRFLAEQGYTYDIIDADSLQ